MSVSATWTRAALDSSTRGQRSRLHTCDVSGTGGVRDLTRRLPMQLSLSRDLRQGSRFRVRDTSRVSGGVWLRAVGGMGDETHGVSGACGALTALEHDAVAAAFIPSLRPPSCRCEQRRLLMKRWQYFWQNYNGINLKIILVSAQGDL